MEHILIHSLDKRRVRSRARNSAEKSDGFLPLKETDTRTFVTIICITALHNCKLITMRCVRLSAEHARKDLSAFIKKCRRETDKFSGKLPSKKLSRSLVLENRERSLKDRV